MPRSDKPATPVGRGVVRIDLDAIAHNLDLLRQRCEPAGTMAIVKADAYGHGAIPVARRLAQAGAQSFGIAFLTEGIALRSAGIQEPILVLGPTLPGEPPGYRDHGLTPTISSLDQLELWDAWTRSEGVVQDVHLKVDSGMSRLGVPLEAVSPALDGIRTAPGLRLTGFLSHLAEADRPENRGNERQMQRFAHALELLTTTERDSVVIHLANSGAAKYLPDSRHQMVRLGIALFGVDPTRKASDLRPAMTVASRVNALRNISAGTHVGYGSTWTAERETTLAVVPVGYGDGYPWRLSNRGSVLVGGRAYPIVGRVSMDMTVIDTTDGEVGLGDEAVLLGTQGEAALSAWDLAEAAETMAWEVLCAFGLRLPRDYVG